MAKLTDAERNEILARADALFEAARENLSEAIKEADPTKRRGRISLAWLQARKGDALLDDLLDAEENGEDVQ